MHRRSGAVIPSQAAANLLTSGDSLLLLPSPLTECPRRAGVPGRAEADVGTEYGVLDDSAEAGTQRVGNGAREGRAASVPMRAPT